MTAGYRIFGIRKDSIGFYPKESFFCLFGIIKGDLYYGEQIKKETNSGNNECSNGVWYAYRDKYTSESSYAGR